MNRISSANSRRVRHMCATRCLVHESLARGQTADHVESPPPCTWYRSWVNVGSASAFGSPRSVSCANTKESTWYSALVLLQRQTRRHSGTKLWPRPRLAEIRRKIWIHRHRWSLFHSILPEVRARRTPRVPWVSTSVVGCGTTRDGAVSKATFPCT